MNNQQKNRAVVVISIEQIRELFLTPQEIGFVKRPIITNRIAPSGLPETARCISAHDDYARNGIACILEDESFPESNPGEHLPVIKVEWTMYKIKVEEHANGN